MNANLKSNRNRWLWTVIGSIAFAILSGLGMSNMDYYPGAFLWGLSASGWSVIGFPILMAIVFVSTMPFNWLADRGKPRFALIIGAGCYALFFGLELRHSTPSARASWALGQELPATTTILALKRHDTFNDGFSFTLNFRCYGLIWNKSSVEMNGFDRSRATGLRHSFPTTAFHNSPAPSMVNT